MPKKGLVLPESMRSELIMPFGELLSEKEAIGRLRRCEKLVTVGDMVSLRMLENGIEPDVMVYDLMTERSAMPVLRDMMGKVAGLDVMVKNPAGHIMPDMVKQIQGAMARKTRTKMQVEGEEDLAALVCAACAPDGTCIMYGMPRKGVVLFSVDEEVRNKARTLMGSMEELD